MTPQERRALLTTIDNPNRATDYITTLDWHDEDQQVKIRLRFIPDKVILTQAGFVQYCLALAADQSKPLEETAGLLLDDANNELVARWVQVSATCEDGNNCHSVLLEDQQPQWENRVLLSRLSKI